MFPCLKKHAKDALKQQMMCSDIPICNCSVLLFFFPFEFCHVGLEFGPWTVPFRLCFGCVDFAAAGTLHCKLSLLSWVLERQFSFHTDFAFQIWGARTTAFETVFETRRCYCLLGICMEVATQTLKYGSNGTKPSLAFFTLFFLAACEMAGVSKYWVKGGCKFSCCTAVQVLCG